MAAAITRMVAACAANGKVAGSWCASAEMASALRAQGYRFVVPGHDVIWLKAEKARRLALLRV